MSSKPKLIPGIPAQKKGSFHDTESRKIFDDEESALQEYQMLEKRFLSINDWQEYCKKKSAEFKLYDSSGNHITRNPEENDLIRIDIPGPRNPESKGYEWVKIEQISDQSLNDGEIENLIINCVPTSDPNQKNGNIAHFYSKDSSSTFKISRGSKYIKIAIYGRNETPNMDTNLAGKIRNLMIGFGGMFGMSKTQWKFFADEILKF